MIAGCHGNTFPCILAKISIFWEILWGNIAQNQICYNFPKICSVRISVVWQFLHLRWRISSSQTGFKTRQIVLYPIFKLTVFWQYLTQNWQSLGFFFYLSILMRKSHNSDVLTHWLYMLCSKRQNADQFHCICLYTTPTWVHHCLTNPFNSYQSNYSQISHQKTEENSSTSHHTPFRLPNLAYPPSQSIQNHSMNSV